MSERVTAEQVQACLDIVDVFSVEHYDKRLDPDEQMDEEHTLYGFKVPSARIPEFVIGQLISPPFPDYEYGDHVDVSVKRTVPLSNDQLLYDEALVVSFVRGFQSQTIRGTTGLDCSMGFPDTTGAVSARIEATISASTRDHERERFQLAYDLVMYHAQLDARLKNEGLPPSERTSERIEAEDYIRSLRDKTGVSGNEQTIDLMPFLGGDEKDMIHDGAELGSSRVETLRSFLGSLSVRDRQRTGYEELALRFGSGGSL